MSSHVVRLTRSGATLIDFQLFANNVLSGWNLAPYEDKICVEDEMVLNIRGANQTTFFDNLTTFGRALTDGQDNYEQLQNGMPYTPIFLQFKRDGNATTMQSEWFGGDPSSVENFASAALRNNLLPLTVKFKRRPYWEELSPQVLATSQNIVNDGGVYDISGVRGDLPSPLAITIRTAAVNQDRVLIAAKARGTVTNFVNLYEGEGYTTKHSEVSVSTVDANMSGGARVRWTPTDTSAHTILTWTIDTNIADQLGTYRVLVRCRDNSDPFNIMIRVRAGVYTSGNAGQYGEYGSYRKFLNGTGTASANGSAGTTNIPLIDCGIITLPPVDTQGVTPSKMIIELEGKAAAASGTFDIDCFYLMPLYELPTQSGQALIRLPIELGNGADPNAILTGADRNARGYLDAAGVLQYIASEIRGSPLYVKPNTTVRLLVLTQTDSSLKHKQALTNIVSVSAIPHARYPTRGT